MTSLSYGSDGKRVSDKQPECTDKYPILGSFWSLKWAFQRTTISAVKLKVLMFPEVSHGI